MIDDEAGKTNQGALSDEEMAKIRSRSDAATPGPWREYIEDRDSFSGSDFIMTEGNDLNIIGASSADYEFIAHARQDIPKLLAEIERLRSLIGKMYREIGKE